MNNGQFLTIYNALKEISADDNLNKDNVIKAIKNKLSSDSDEYKEWEKGKFSLDHVFTTTVGDRASENALLIHACDSADLEVVRFLLKVGASVNVTAGGKNPFTVAIESEYGSKKDAKAIVDLLIGKVDAHVSAAGENVNNTIVKAVERGNFRVFNALKEAGASLDIETPSGTLLNWAEGRTQDPNIKKEDVEKIINTLKAHLKGKDKTPEKSLPGNKKEDTVDATTVTSTNDNKTPKKNDTTFWSEHKIALGVTGLCVVGAIAAYVLAYPLVALA